MYMTVNYLIIYNNLNSFIYVNNKRAIKLSKPHVCQEVRGIDFYSNLFLK